MTPSTVARPLAREPIAFRSRPAGALDPLALAAAGAPGDFRFYLRGGGLELGGSGAVAVVEARGEGRLEALADGARRLLGRVKADPDAPPLAAPRLLGGFGFADRGRPRGGPGTPDWTGFPPARFVLPARLAVRAGGETWVTAAAGRGEETAGARTPPLPPACVSDPGDPAAFLLGVAAARAAIEAGALEKVVLARAIRARAGRPIDPFALAGALREAEPRCCAFAFVAPGGAAFVGATPERLVRRAGARVEAFALAGSAPRGATPGEDHALASRLLSSEKERREHALVVDAVCAALRPLGAVSRRPVPGVLALAHVQHLFTPVEAVLREPAALAVLDLAARLHPTPAVAGTPRDRALAFLAEREGLDRGWYAGAIGWVDAPGDGDLFVALRSALLRGEQAWLFAGAGIVAGSDPEAEWRETGVKLGAVGRALGLAPAGAGGVA